MEVKYHLHVSTVLPLARIVSGTYFKRSLRGVKGYSGEIKVLGLSRTSNPDSPVV